MVKAEQLRTFVGIRFKTWQPSLGTWIRFFSGHGRIFFAGGQRQRDARRTKRCALVNWMKQKWNFAVGYLHMCDLKWLRFKAL